MILNQCCSPRRRKYFCNSIGTSRKWRRGSLMSAVEGNPDNICLAVGEHKLVLRCRDLSDDYVDHELCDSAEVKRARGTVTHLQVDEQACRSEPWLISIHPWGYRRPHILRYYCLPQDAANASWHKAPRNGDKRRLHLGSLPLSKACRHFRLPNEYDPPNR